MTSFPSDKITLIGSCHSDKVEMLYLLQGTRALELLTKHGFSLHNYSKSESLWQP